MNHTCELDTLMRSTTRVYLSAPTNISQVPHHTNNLLCTYIYILPSLKIMACIKTKFTNSEGKILRFPRLRHICLRSPGRLACNAINALQPLCGHTFPVYQKCACNGKVSGHFPRKYQYSKFSLQAHTWDTEKVCL